jgi:hypothetical protein
VTARVTATNELADVTLTDETAQQATLVRRAQ